LSSDKPESIKNANFFSGACFFELQARTAKDSAIIELLGGRVLNDPQDGSQDAYS